MVQPGDRVRAPNADDTAEVEATFLAPGDPDEAVDVPSRHTGSGTMRRDVGWVHYEDGTTKAWPYERIHPI
jgi:hypothetical protein